MFDPQRSGAMPAAQSSSDDFNARGASIARETSETSVRVALQLDQEAAYDNETGIGFLDHMLDLFAKHGGFGLQISCDGDLHVDEHHTVEDVAISLGDAFRKALGDKTFIRRFGFAYAPMDDALARAVVDLSGRFYLRYRADFDRDQVGGLSVEMVEHFWHAFAERARCNLHIEALCGKNAHHTIEAVFKAVALALRDAVRRDPSFARMPSTKGTL